MRIFDFHAHIYPDNVADKAIESVAMFYGVTANKSGTVSSLLEAGKSAGITDYLIHSVAIFPKTVSAVNTFIAEQCSLHSEFTGFGTLHPLMEDMDEEIDRIEALGLKGIKLHPDSQQFNVDSDEAMLMFSKLEGRLPVLVHCGDYRVDYSHPKRLSNVLDTFPNLTVVGAHMGGWLLFDLAVEYLENRKCYLDISSTIPFIGLRRAKELIDIYGSERIIFGTDYPMWSPTESVQSICKLGLDNEQLENIFYKNALKVIGGLENA